jgi:hypothetical protein
MDRAPETRGSGGRLVGRAGDEARAPSTRLCKYAGVPGPDEPRHRLASELLDAITQCLGRMPDSPQKRQLGAKAESYRRTIEQFRTSRPAPDRSAALDEMVLALHGKLLEVMRRDSLDLTPGPVRVGSIEDEDTPPPSTPLARVQLRGSKDRR